MNVSRVLALARDGIGVRMISSNFSRMASGVLVAFGMLGLTACQDSTSTLGTKLPDPVITSLQPDTGAPGSEVLITGNNFGNNSSQIRILIGGQVPQGITAVEPGKSVRFLVPTLETNKYEVQLILGNRLSNSKSFTVLDPSSTTEPGFTAGLSLFELESKYGASKTGDSILTLTPQNGFTGPVALELVNAPTGMSVTPASTSITTKDAKQIPIHLELGTNVKPGNYAITLKASSAGIERKLDLSVPISTFVASLSGESVFNMSPGLSIQRNLMITPSTGFTGTVGLSLLDAPTDLTVTPSSLNAATSGNSTTPITLNLKTNAPSGRYQFKLHVVSDGFARDIPLTLQTADFTATLNPNPIVAEVGSSQNVTLKLVPTGRVFCQMNLSNLLVGGASGATVTPSEFSVDSTQPVDVPLTFKFGNQAFNGGSISSAFEIGCNGIVKSVPFTSQLQDVSITLNPKSLAMAPGTSKQVTATITPRGGFLGPLNVSLTGLPVGVSVTSEGPQVNVAGLNDITQTFTFISAANAISAGVKSKVAVSNTNFSRSQEFSSKVIAIRDPFIDYSLSSDPVVETSSIDLYAEVNPLSPSETDFDSSVTWSILSGGGTLTKPTISGVTYTAPKVINSTFVEVKATSNWDTTKSSTATLKIQPMKIEIGTYERFGDYVILPDRWLAQAGRLKIFRAQGTGKNSPGVTWEYTDGSGVATSESLELTIPNIVGQEITLTARSISYPDKFMRVVLTVIEQIEYR
jgi:IPT/TIG domain